MKIFLETNVWDAALARIRYLFDEFEHVIVCSSGGKDSTVIMHLALIVAEEKGRLPVKVLFVDQESEWTATVEYMRGVMADPRVDPVWLQIPIRLFNTSSSREDWLYCWAPDREADWIRPKEAISIKENIFGTMTFGDVFGAYQNTMYPANEKVAILAGMRAQESPGRMYALTGEPKYKHLTYAMYNNYPLKTHLSIYPIYDWGYKDVWKAIHSNHWPFNRQYLNFYMYGWPIAKMRVSSLIHETATINLYVLQETDPVLYSALTHRLAGVDTTGKLQEDFFVRTLPYMFTTWREYRDFLLDRLITDDHREAMRKSFKTWDDRFEGSVRAESLVKAEVSCILANDYHLVKFHNWISNPSNAIPFLIRDGLLDNKFAREYAKKRNARRTDIPPLEFPAG